ncbi:MAG: hypothetical protein LBR94_08915 [Desulfovibrio sp.]|jgi:hypothetical protein|nr:hypothetical protein [Desulfovibrio sp.]
MINKILLSIFKNFNIDKCAICGCHITTTPDNTRKEKIKAEKEYIEICKKEGIEIYSYKICENCLCKKIKIFEDEKYDSYLNMKERTYLEELQLSNVTKKNISGTSRQNIIKKCAKIEESFNEEYSDFVKQHFRTGCYYYISVENDRNGIVTIVVKAKKDDEYGKYIGELGEIEHDEINVIYGIDIFSYMLNNPKSIELYHPVFFETNDKKGKQIINVCFDATVEYPLRISNYILRSDFRMERFGFYYDILLKKNLDPS